MEILSQTATASVHSFLRDLNMYPDRSLDHKFAKVLNLANKATDTVHDYLKDLNLYPYENNNYQ